MELIELLQILKVGGIGIGVLLLTLIKIPKIEVNIWGWLAKRLGKAMNCELYDKMCEMSNHIETLDKTLQKRIEISEEYKASEKRRAILIFNDELYRDIHHSQERFNDILEQIDGYETYCNENPDYPNNKAVAAINHIKEVYQKCLDEHNFLA